MHWLQHSRLKKREILAAEDDAAGGLRLRGGHNKQPGAGECRSRCLVELSLALPARTVQDALDHYPREVRRRLCGMTDHRSSAFV